MRKETTISFEKERKRERDQTVGSSLTFNQRQIDRDPYKTRRRLTRRSGIYFMILNRAYSIERSTDRLFEPSVLIQLDERLPTNEDRSLVNSPMPFFAHVNAISLDRANVYVSTAIINDEQFVRRRHEYQRSIGIAGADAIFPTFLDGSSNEFVFTWIVTFQGKDLILNVLLVS